MKLSEEIKHCLDNDCGKCKHYEERSALTCRKLLKAAYEEIKKKEEVEEEGNIERDIEKDLIEIECAIKIQKEKDNTFTMSVLQRCYKLASDLKEYRDLEEQGKLLKLPCAAGDTVYVIRINNEAYMRCERVLEIVESKFEIRYFDSINKTVFLTEPEAEEALQKMNETEGEND